nr:hypothetical protein [Tanacetum cinerariifolium]
MLHVLRVEMVINSPWMLYSSNPFMADNLPKIVWFSTYHISCMKSWLVQKQTALGQTATGKESSNPFMASSLPKTILYSFLHKICFHSDAAGGFEQIINFLSGSYIHHALTVNPHVYISCIKQFWNTVVVKRSGDVTRLQALVDKKRIVIFEEVVCEILQFNDAEGVVCLPNEEIFAGLSRMGYEKPFIQLIIQSNITDLSKHTNRYISPVLTQKVFANMRMVGKGFLGVGTPLFENMLAVRAIDVEEEVQVPAQDDVVQEHVIEEIATEVLNKCSALVLRIKGLETANATQQLEIIKLKARVKKFERLNKGRISVDIETNEGIKLEVNQEKSAEIEGRHADTQAEIYNIALDHSSKVLSMQEDTEVQKVVEVVTTAKLITAVVTIVATQVAAASTPMSAAKPKVLKIAAAPAVSTRRKKGVVIRDPEEELHTDTLAETPTVKDKGKGFLIEDPKPMKKKDQVEMDAEFKKKPQSESEARKNIISYLKNTEGYKMEFFKGKTYNQILLIFQARFDANMKFLFKIIEEMEKEDEEIIKSINETPSQKAAKRRKLSEEVQEADDLKKRLEIVHDEDDDVFVEATPLAQKVPIVDYQVVVIDNKPRYNIIRADDTHQFYISFTTLLKNFDREDLETLWKIVKDRFSTKKPTNFLDEYLLLALKTIFRDLDEQDAI